MDLKDRLQELMAEYGLITQQDLQVCLKVLAGNGSMGRQV